MEQTITDALDASLPVEVSGVGELENGSMEDAAEEATTDDSSGSSSAEEASKADELENARIRETTSETTTEDSATGESSRIGAEVASNDAKTRNAVLARQAAIENPMFMEAIRRTTLGLRGGEVIGKLTFAVPKSQVLHLPPALDDNLERVTLCRRFESLHPSRREDDASYFEAVEKGSKVTLVTALPSGYESGGWRCHAKESSNERDHTEECLRVNLPDDECCAKCQRPKPRLRPDFAYLRLLPLGLRRQREEYLRIIKECDSELERCDAAEREASERIVAYNERGLDHEEGVESESNGTSNALDASDENNIESAEFDPEDELMMDVDLVQKGSWQRVNARTLLPKLAERKSALNKRLANARAELSIMIQAAFSLAVPHAQRVSRRFLVRLRLDAIRKSVLDLARFSAAVEIQRIVRSKLASREADRLRTLRDHRMATKIQSIVRRRFAIVERRRLWAIYMEKLRNRSATIIQSLYRCHTSRKRLRLLAEERRRQLEAAAKARQASLEKDSATIIQKHWRRIWAKEKCSNRRIELGMHQRLLMYLERYVVDGCMWSFVKSINDDYKRFERTIAYTIDREEKMAKTFVDKVIDTRDSDHSSAWENYIHLTQNGESSATKNEPKDEATPHDRSTKSPKGKKEVELHSNHRSAIKLYGSPPQHRSIVSRKNKSRKARTRPRSHERIDEEPVQQKSSEIHSLDHHHGEVDGGQADSVLDPSYQQEAKRLARLTRMKDKLKGRYLRFDIPDSLDDTVSRFIMAVTLRYNSETPGESSLHDNFEAKLAEKEHRRKCMEYAEPLIQHLHAMGIVFIRQLLPAENMASILSGMEVTEEFLILSNSLLNVLYQITGGNYLNRKYLMAKCRHLLETSSKGAKESHFCIASFLGECGAAGSDSYNDNDNPGGIWVPKKATLRSTQNQVKPSIQETNRNRRTENPLRPTTGKTRNKSWVIPYTAKIISENEANHPALGPYRHGQLLGPG